MLDHFRRFDAQDPFGRTWSLEYLWQQTAISIRHADAVDVKFQLTSGDEKLEKVIALPHPLLLEESRTSGCPLTDPWCMKLACLHLKRMVTTWEDMDKTLVTVSSEDLKQHNAELSRLLERAEAERIL